MAGTISFDSYGSDPASDAFSLIVNYEDGTSIMMPPVIHEYLMGNFIDFMNRHFPGWSSSNGLITLPNAGVFKPDYATKRFNATDWAYYNANRDVATNAAIKMVNPNNDLKVDFEFYAVNANGCGYVQLFIKQ